MNATTVPDVEKPRPRRWWRILKRVLIGLVILVLILVFGVFPYLLARLVTGASTRPMDRRETSTPADYEVQYKDVEFQTLDGVKISGWLIPARPGHATIIYSHGLFRSRRELLPRAMDICRLGYGALLYDSRNHGESGPARVTLGYNERLDAEAAVKYLQEQVGTKDPIVLFGISMGAATALLAAAETPEVAAVISDSSFLSFRDTTDHHMKLFLHLPSFPVANEVRYYIEKRAHFDGDKLNPLEAVKQMGKRPILFIAGANDKRMPPEIAETLRNASETPASDLLIVDGEGSEIHGHAYQANPRLYIVSVAKFLHATVDANQ